jgi:hypothetical protein
MKTILLALLSTSCLAGGHLSLGTSNSSSSGDSSGPAASHVNATEAYDKFAVLGAKLGVPLEGQAGFTCGPPRGTDGFSTQNHSCVKFLDERCKDRPTKIHHIRSTGDVDRGQNCFMDEFNAATYLDRKFTAPPLLYLRITGTDSNNPKVFQITYTFPADDLTDDSKLGKALIAKYGEPAYRNPPTQMTWKAGDVEMRAACRGIGGDNAAKGEFCTITVEHDALDQQEREKQRVNEEAARRAGAPPPPPL